MPIPHGFQQLIEQADQMLWATYISSVDGTQPTIPTQIRFPRKRDGKLRVSEQEARFVITGLLFTSPLIYTIETPTTLTYQFTGASGSSAQSDVTVYEPSGDNKLNIEFKAHGFSEDRQDKMSILKDIEKLLREPSTAFWFHTFEGVDNSTLIVSWNAFLSDIRTVLTAVPPESMSPTEFVFHACVLRHQFSVEISLLIDPAAGIGAAPLHTPPPTYTVTRNALTNFEEKDSWKFRRASAR